MTKRSLDVLQMILDSAATSASLSIILLSYWPYLFAVRCKRYFGDRLLNPQITVTGFPK
jgi:hypothetical protein